ncbi:DUF5302 family protein [Lolliginicoccus levis]|uniref:DUF5302 family protein n=1 Tax=Lolliginicoccus levis TaxID=2919542 RepID=UPI00241E586C|nr:DUF5302 family protein [Lolliginicoccus levis]
MADQSSKISDEQRKHFAEALAHKQSSNKDPHRGSPKSSGKAHGPHAAEGGHSMFRRKSG